MEKKHLKIEIPKGYEIDEINSTFENIVFKPIEKKFIDLGLPSGNLWCDTNEGGFYSWDEMMNSFDKNNLPKLTDFAELYDYCKWSWDKERKGMIVTGPNGNSIFFPASGSRCNSDGAFNIVGNIGYCWSCSPGEHSYDAYGLNFYRNGDVNPAYGNHRANGYSVHLLKRC